MSFTIKTVAAAVIAAGSLLSATLVPAQAAPRMVTDYAAGKPINCIKAPNTIGCPPPPGGGGGHHHHHHYDGNWQFGIWFGPGPWYNDPVYPYASPYYDEDYHVYAGMTCNAAKGFLRSQGYRNVHATDCAGRTYGFTATKQGHKYKISINKYSGRYSRSRIY